jgi:hypothetical protein
MVWTRWGEKWWFTGVEGGNTDGGESDRAGYSQARVPGTRG